MCVEFVKPFLKCKKRIIIANSDFSIFFMIKLHETTKSMGNARFLKNAKVTGYEYIKVFHSGIIDSQFTYAFNDMSDECICFV